MFELDAFPALKPAVWSPSLLMTNQDSLHDTSLYHVSDLLDTHAVTVIQDIPRRSKALQTVL